MLFASHTILGDFVDDVIRDARSPDFKLRLASTIALGNRAASNSSDKRAIPVMLERLGDTEASIRSVAASAFGIPGWVDAQVDACLRVRVIATLQALADPKVEKNEVTRTRADQSAKLLVELGMLDTNVAQNFARVCAAGASPLTPPSTPPIGPLVDPMARTQAAFGTREKVAIAGATMIALGVLGYAILSPRHPAPSRKRVKRR